MLFAKEQTWTFPEYMEYFKAKKAKELSKREARQIENKISQLIKNPTVKKAMVTMAALMLHGVEAAADTAQTVYKINTAGAMILSITRTALYWFAIISCAIEIGKCLLSGDTGAIGRIIGKYIIAFLGVYCLPWIFDLIVGVFS